jgi:hypothetical protein
LTLQEFIVSINNPEPPATMGPLLKAMWYDARGDWYHAHLIAQEENKPTGSRVHAYLHRKEGDFSNAGYWYRKGGIPFCSHILEREWKEIVEVLLS